MTLHAGPTSRSAATRRVTVVAVADGLGVGGAPDAQRFATTRANTLANTAAAVGGLSLPTLGRWGLGCLTDVEGVHEQDPAAWVAAAVERSAGNDTPTGHWELFGSITDTAPVTFPDGFPGDLLDELCATWGVDAVLANTAISGLEVLDRFGAEHLRTGHPIVYTSSDSVLQVACHTAVTSVDELHRRCEQARTICDDRWPIGRIIARPFDGTDGAWHRCSQHRHDWPAAAPDTAVDRLSAAGVPVVAVGKISDIFCHRGLAAELHPSGLDESFDMASAAHAALRDGGVVVVNLAEFDYRGHARDPEGFAAALSRLDRWCGQLSADMAPGDRFVLCADHGNDPTFVVDDHGAPSTDHTRERVPMITYVAGSAHGGCLRDVHMSDLAQTLCAWHGADATGLAGAALSI